MIRVKLHGIIKIVHINKIQGEEGNYKTEQGIVRIIL